MANRTKKTRRLSKADIAALLKDTRKGMRGVRPKPSPLALCAAHVGVSLGTLGELVGANRSVAVSWVTRGVPKESMSKLRSTVEHGSGIKARVPWEEVFAMVERAA